MPIPQAPSAPLPPALLVSPDKESLGDLPRPWPLLKEGQDPASLEARVAFHLHRLKLVGQPLSQAGYDRNAAADIAAARTPLSTDALSDLATRLSLNKADLTRPLTPAELRQWAFYRHVAADPQHVWEHARALWQGKGLSDRQAADIMGYGKSVIARAKQSPSRVTLGFAEATKLTTALEIAGGPEALLPLPNRDSEEPLRS